MPTRTSIRCLLLAVWFLPFQSPSGAALGAEPDAKVVASDEARNHVDETCTVEMTVRSTKNAVPRKEYYLDSEEDFRDEKNFAVVISHDHADRFRQAGIDDPSVYYKGQKVRVTGKVIREAEQVRIRVDAPDQIVLVK